MARNFIYDLEDKPTISYLIHDGDSNLKGGFEDIFKSKDIEIIEGSCRTNSKCERMNQTIKHECANRLIFIRENSLRKSLKQYQEHYNKERPHQGIENMIPDFPDKQFHDKNEIIQLERLGGLMKYYFREIA